MRQSDALRVGEQASALFAGQGGEKQMFDAGLYGFGHVNLWRRFYERVAFPGPVNLFHLPYAASALLLPYSTRQPPVVLFGPLACH